jgi:subtilisin family serine protease
MTLRTTRPVGAIAVALLVAALTATSASADAVVGAPLAEPLPLAKAKPVATAAHEHVGATLAEATGKVTAFVELDEAPAVETFHAEKARGASEERASQAAKQTRKRSGDKADRVLDVLRGKDAMTKEVARTANAVSGLLVNAGAAEIRELASLPEVKAVRLSVPKVVQNASSVQLTKAMQVWQQTGHHGTGMRIGIIDTGIDYTHSDFGGAGTKAAYEAVDRTKADPSFFPTAKVVGGFDFAGEDYDGGDPQSAPKPDVNPLDCQGHGTHVAGTAAGFGENADGSTFTGDYAGLTPDVLNGMKIGPGTAPEASLYALKVFGCKGSTNLTSQAMDWALDPNGDGDFSDHLDVVNMSLGNDFGAQDDPDSLFVRKLVANGVMVVASAGNGGDFYDVGGSPANTPEALAVANTRDAFALLDGVEVPGSGNEPGQYGQSFTGYADLDRTSPVVAVSDKKNLDGCKSITDSLAGKIVWLEWDDNDSTRACGSGERTDNAEAAGAAGVVLSSTRDNFAAGIAGNANIPVFQFTGTATSKVRPALEAGTLQVRMTGKLRNSVPTTTPKLADTVTPSSARGSRGAVAAKPDIAAPGDTILSAAFHSGNGRVSMGGTSMASPHVAGITALVREVHPDWTPEEVKAAVMNTADGDVKSGDDSTTGTAEAPMRVGAGRVDAKAAVDNQVLAMVEDNPGSVGVSFGPVEVGGPVSPTKTVKIVNKGDRATQVAASYVAATAVPGVSFDLSTRSVRLGPRDQARIEVKLRISNPADLRKVADPTVAKEQAGAARQFLAEASGWLMLKPGGEPGLRVPVYAAPKPTADITAARIRFGKGAGQALLALGGRGLRQGAGEMGYRSMVSVFELQGTSDRLPDCGGAVKTGCAVNGTAKGGDLRYVGVTSTAPMAKSEGKPGDALLAFGVVTWNNWANLGSNTTPEVRIDTDGDGKDDFLVKVVKPTDAHGGVTADVWLAQTKSTAGDVVDEQPLNGQYGDVDTNVFDSNVAVLPVSLKALGIDVTKASHRISYTVGTSGSYAAPGNQDGFVDKIGSPSSFDPLAPGLWVRGGGAAALSYVAGPGTALVVNRNPDALAADKAGSLLVLSHHNATDKRAQVVEADSRG